MLPPNQLFAESLPLGINLQAFIFQLITFIFFFLVLRRYAFKPLARLLEKRRLTIEHGVRLGMELEEDKKAVAKQAETIIRKAREEADRIVAGGHKEAREVIHEGEKALHRKTEAAYADADARLKHETLTAKRSLEKDIIGLIGEATEALVTTKVDSEADQAIIEKVLAGHEHD